VSVLAVMIDNDGRMVARYRFAAVPRVDELVVLDRAGRSFWRVLRVVYMPDRAPVGIVDDGEDVAIVVQPVESSNYEHARLREVVGTLDAVAREEAALPAPVWVVRRGYAGVVQVDEESRKRLREELTESEWEQAAEHGGGAGSEEVDDDRSE
jgi:hypothetical protein